MWTRPMATQLVYARAQYQHNFSTADPTSSLARSPPWTTTTSPLVPLEDWCTVSVSNSWPCDQPVVGSVHLAACLSPYQHRTRCILKCHSALIQPSRILFPKGFVLAQCCYYHSSTPPFLRCNANLQVFDAPRTHTLRPSRPEHSLRHKS